MENNVNAITEGLNEEQKKAVQCVDGPVLIVAGAGSGKTRVLTSRVANILGLGCPPERVLALTFTRKAADEMKERIALMVGQSDARRVVMGTFHAVFVRFLRKYADSLGYPSSFTIYDTGDSLTAVRACIRELELDDKVYKAKDVFSKISREKNELYTVKAYKNSSDKLFADNRAHKGDFIRIYERYQEKLKSSGVMDFDDILVNMNILLRDNPDALKEISSRFSYIMVDEYQDTNYAQYLIIRQLAAQHRNICVVGDDSQSIYAFRGARIENIINFSKDYPECRTFRLERNYRSTPVIVEAANSLIAHNDGRIPKKCFAVGERGELIRVLNTSSDIEESISIVSEICNRVRSDAAQYSDFAILYRTNSQSRSLEESLRRRNIPYRIYSGNAFFDRQEVRDVMAYFKLAVNPNDDEAFKRIVNKPARGIGDTSLSALNECARAHSCSLFRAVEMPDTSLYGLKDAAKGKMAEFCRMMNGFVTLLHSGEAYDSAKEIADKSGIYGLYASDKSIEGLSRLANIEELLNSVQAFVDQYDDSEDPGHRPTLGEYLDSVSLVTNVDASEGEDDGNKVALMTVHSAKGLEFPYVFVAGMEENLFPSMTMISSNQDIEEERRLFYVAMTRAKRLLTISYSSSRMRNGKHEYNSPSRFVKEIDSKYLDNPITDTGDSFGSGGFSFGSRGSGSPWSGASSRRYDTTRRSSASSSGSGTFGRPAPRTVSAVVDDPDFRPTAPSELMEGMKVKHVRFGQGRILEISGVGDERKARIEFDDYGVKVILLKYGKLAAIS